VCRAEDTRDLADAIQRYFASDLYKDLPARRQRIRDFACNRYSWSRVAAITTDVYAKLDPAMTEIRSHRIAL
jgi:glycosyltransferase involved in cell wall biosynthesis